MSPFLSILKDPYSKGSSVWGLYGGPVVADIANSVFSEDHPKYGYSALVL